ncbi:uncharacterized protein V6R79_015547 [Siganus canaliculatus]
MTALRMFGTIQASMNHVTGLRMSDYDSDQLLEDLNPSGELLLEVAQTPISQRRSARIAASQSGIESLLSQLRAHGVSPAPGLQLAQLQELASISPQKALRLNVVANGPDHTLHPIQKGERPLQDHQHPSTELSSPLLPSVSIILPAPECDKKVASSEDITTIFKSSDPPLIGDLNLRYGKNIFYQYHNAFSNKAALYIAQSNIRLNWSVLDSEILIMIVGGSQAVSCRMCGNMGHSDSLACKDAHPRSVCPRRLIPTRLARSRQASRRGSQRP